MEKLLAMILLIGKSGAYVFSITALDNRNNAMIMSKKNVRGSAFFLGVSRLLCLWFFPLVASLNGSVVFADTLQVNGYTRYTGFYQDYPANSAYQLEFGPSSIRQTADFRMNLQWDTERWQWDASYQVIALQGDSVEAPAVSQYLDQGDKRRLFDFQSVVYTSSRSLVYERLDRFSVGYLGDSVSVKFGRQALSWGNGQLFNPMDLFNPYDPKAISRDYKTGDDMLYSQYLLSNGNDLQGVWVLRRDDRGAITREVDSQAFKFHGFVGSSEFDILLASHYDESIAAVGNIVSFFGALIRADIVLHQSDENSYVNGVANVSYSWVWWDLNWAGTLEYFYSGAGRTFVAEKEPDTYYRPSLIQQIERGELFTVGRQYCASAISLEITPLWRANVNTFYNIFDHSTLVQLVLNNNVAQNLNLTLAMNKPLGPKNSEFSRSPVWNTSSTEDAFLLDYSLFAELTWYF